MRKDALHEKVEFTNVRHLLEWATKTYRGKYAFSYKKNAHKSDIEKVTFEEFGEDVRALASELLAMGCAGKHCAVIGKFTYE